MLALCNTVALQCGHIRVAPTEFGRATLISRLLAAVAHGTGLNPAFFILPAKLDVAAHARTRGNGDRTRLHVADDDAALEHVDPFGGLDIALQLAADHDDSRQHLAGQMRSRIHAEIAVDANIALEAARHAHVSGTLDL